MKIWVARAKGPDYTPNYYVSQEPLKRMEAEKSYGWTCSPAPAIICWQAFEAACKAGGTPFRLKPGEGPVQVELAVRIKRVAKRYGRCAVR